MTDIQDFFPEIDHSKLPYVSGCCKGEKCNVCEKDATHKVEETIFDDDIIPFRHRLTAYLCCEHFQLILGPAAVKQCQFNHPNETK